MVADRVDEWDISEMSAEEIADVATSVAKLHFECDAIEDMHKRHVQSPASSARQRPTRRRTMSTMRPNQTNFQADSQ